MAVVMYELEALMNKLRRIADMLEKLGVAGIALAIYQEQSTGVGWAILALLLSICLTRREP